VTVMTGQYTRVLVAWLAALLALYVIQHLFTP
jgi:hypothetical protein